MTAIPEIYEIRTKFRTHIGGGGETHRTTVRQVCRVEYKYRSHREVVFGGDSDLRYNQYVNLRQVALQGDTHRVPLVIPRYIRCVVNLDDGMARVIDIRQVRLGRIRLVDPDDIA